MGLDIEGLEELDGAASLLGNCSDAYYIFTKNNIRPATMSFKIQTKFCYITRIFSWVIHIFRDQLLCILRKLMTLKFTVLGVSEKLFAFSFKFYIQYFGVN